MFFSGRRRSRGYPILHSSLPAALVGYGSPRAASNCWLTPVLPDYRQPWTAVTSSYELYKKCSNAFPPTGLRAAESTSWPLLSRNLWWLRWFVGPAGGLFKYSFDEAVVVWAVTVVFPFLFFRAFPSIHPRVICDVGAAKGREEKGRNRVLSGWLHWRSFLLTPSLLFQFRFNKTEYILRLALVACFSGYPRTPFTLPAPLHNLQAIKLGEAWAGEILLFGLLTGTVAQFWSVFSSSRGPAWLSRGPRNAISYEHWNPGSLLSMTLLPFPCEGFARSP